MTATRAAGLVCAGALALAGLASCRGRVPGEGKPCEVDGAACLEAPEGDVPEATRPRNVVLLVGDGMGVEQARAARIFANGDVEPLGFETLPARACVQTTNASGGVTDSAAAATAMATGIKVDNGVLSLAIPGDGAPLTTALELLHAAGKSAGLVTTATRVTDATPAAFGAHVASRYDDAAVSDALLGVSRPEVLMGRPGGPLDEAAAQAAGYATATTAAGLEQALAAAPTRLVGLFDDDEVPLAERTRAALALLAEDPDGFFLLVEHEGPDNGGHNNDLAEVVAAVLELDAAVAAAQAMVDPSTTLLLVTGDHETGALALYEDAPTAGQLPAHAFGSTHHTAASVPLYATGPGAEGVQGCVDNTAIFGLLTGSAL